jgi:hypothetical protein
MLAMADPVDAVLAQVETGELGDPLPVLAYRRAWASRSTRTS